MSDPQFVPPRHPQFDYKVDYVGNERQPILVVDNFLDGAENLVAIAMEHCQFVSGRDYYPGIQAKVPPFYMRALYVHLRDLISSTFAINPQDIDYSQSMFSMVLTPPDQLATTQSRPHTDSLKSNQFATVHYLCTPDKGGTSLYRHRATGFESLDQARFDEYVKFLAEEEKDPTWKKQYISGSNNYYEEIASYEARFNRLIMYRGNCLHSPKIPPDANFAAHPVNGRLTLNTFIYCK